jgi:prepilin-type N-terminal cleavage/methylation domain-containing protein
MRRNQAGYTLIELMIGMVVGLIVLSGALFIYLQIFTISQTTLASTKLNRELGILLDTMSGDIRRHGYFASNTGSPYQESSLARLSVSGSCIAYGYDSNANGTDDDPRRAFKLDINEPVILYAASASASSCEASEWKQVTDSNVMEVSSLAFKSFVETQSSATATAYTRRIKISVSVADPSGFTKSSRNLTILLPNNVVEN